MGHSLNISRKFCSVKFQTWDYGLGYDVESSLQQKPWRLRSQSCPREAGRGHPLTRSVPTVHLQWLQGRGVNGPSPIQLLLPCPSFFLLNSLEEKMQLHLHPKPLPSGSKHNICKHRKPHVNCSKHYRKSAHFSSQSQTTKLIYKLKQNFLFFCDSN